MKTIKFKYLLPCALLGMMLGVASCVNDLDTVPLDKDELVSDVVFGNELLLRFMQVWPSAVTAGVIPIRMW